MTVWVVTKTLYARDGHLVNDFGHHVQCDTRLIGVFDNPDDAYSAQDDTYNISPYDILPLNESEIRNDETYIDVVVEETEMGRRDENEILAQ